MRIEKRFDDVEVPSQFHSMIDERIEHALEHHAQHVREVRVKLQDINGPKGGIDIKCTLVAEVAGPKTLVIEELAANSSSAVTHAAGRLNNAVKQHLDKIQDHRH